MKHLAALFAGCLLVGPAPAVNVAGNIVTLTEVEARICSDGECILVNKAGVEREIAKRVQAALIACKNAT